MAYLNKTHWALTFLVLIGGEILNINSNRSKHLRNAKSIYAETSVGKVRPVLRETRIFQIFSKHSGYKCG